jgi:protein-tyrosine phosphatase
MFINFKTVENIRDLGGIKTIDGHTIVSKRLLRSSELHNISKRELDILKHKYDLRVVIDFRSTRSTITRKDNIDDSIKYMHMVVLHFLETNTYGTEIKVSPDEFFIDIYRSLAISPEAIATYRNFFRVVLAQEEGCLLYHCRSGKDRTGIATTLLLHALGVDKQSIYQEHFLTNEVMRPLYEQKLRELDPHDIDSINFYHALYIAKKEYIDEYYRAIEEKYGSIDSYLREQIGVSDKEIAILRARYLENNY